MRAAILIVGFALLLPAYGDIYKWVDADDRVHYGDTAPAQPGAERLHSVELPLTPIPGLPPRQSQRPPATTQAPARYVVPASQPEVPLARCIDVKRRAVMAEKSNRKKGAPDLDDWLWKHCRQHSNRLRQVEQSMM